MDAHVRSAHTRKRYTCCAGAAEGVSNIEGWDEATACGREFSTRGNLGKHIRRAHIELGGGYKARKRKGGSAVERITGARDDGVRCVVRGCGEGFGETGALVEHLMVGHGLAESEIEGLMAGVEGGVVGFARPGLQSGAVFVTGEDLVAEAALDLLEEGGVGRREGRGGIEGGAGFWLGGVGGDEGGGAVEEWEREEEEMRRLMIDEIYGGEGGGGMEIDPALL